VALVVLFFKFEIPEVTVVKFLKKRTTSYQFNREWSRSSAVKTPKPTHLSP